MLVGYRLRLSQLSTIKIKSSDNLPHPVLVSLASVPTGHVEQDFIAEFLYWPAWHSTEKGSYKDKGKYPQSHEYQLITV